MTDPEQQGWLPEQPPAEETPAPKYPFWNWVDVGTLIAISLPLFLVALLVVQFFLFALSWQPHAKAVVPIAVQFLFYGLWFGVLYGLIHMRYGQPFWRSLAWVAPPNGWGASFGWGVLTALGSVLLAAVLRPPQITTPLEQLLQDPLSVALMGIFAVTLGPLCEELAFRGFLLPLLARPLGPVLGVMATAAPFALLHGSEYAWGWQPIVIVFLAGSAFGWMRYRTGSTASATAMHSAYNLVFFIGLLAQRYVLQ
jgi:membrane protease YdiL (CAAX protease family)